MGAAGRQDAREAVRPQAVREARLSVRTKRDFREAGHTHPPLEAVGADMAPGFLDVDGPMPPLNVQAG